MTNGVERVPEITAAMENHRDELLIPGNPRFITSRRDPVEPVPVGTYVAMVFRVTGFDRDCDGSLMARLEQVGADGESTGWAPTHLGLYPGTDWVLDDPSVLDRLASPATITPQRQDAVR